MILLSAQLCSDRALSLLTNAGNSLEAAAESGRAISVLDLFRQEGSTATPVSADKVYLRPELLDQRIVQKGPANDLAIGRADIGAAQMLLPLSWHSRSSVFYECDDESALVCWGHS
jgi:hypothetical protein